MANQVSLIKTVKNFITGHGMLQTESHILTALSGGADSVCLLCVLKELQQELGCSLSALHVHHGIRGEEADRDAAYCQKLCAGLDIPCKVVYADVPRVAKEEKLSLEEAARMVRYQALEEHRKQLAAALYEGDVHPIRIAVAHHREDQAETVLWNLFRGSGLKGLGGMEPVHGSLIRPLLEVGKEEILSYLEQNKILWQQDSTNDSDDYTRNRIRHHVLGYATEYINQGATEHICQAARLAGAADDYLRKQAGKWLEQEDVADGSIRVSALLQEEEILQGYILREMFHRCRDLTNVTFRHMDAVRSLLTEVAGGSAKRQVELGDGWMACRSYDRLWFAQANTENDQSGEVSWEPVEVDLERLWEEGKTDREHISPGENLLKEVRWGDKYFTLKVFSYEKFQEIPTNQYTKWINYDTLEKALVFRARQTGDYILLSDGSKKTVKSYMIDEKIPAGERDRIPVIAQGNHVLWIAGYRLSEGAKITEYTRQVLEIQMHGG